MRAASGAGMSQHRAPSPDVDNASALVELDFESLEDVSGGLKFNDEQRAFLNSLGINNVELAIYSLLA